MRWLLTITLGSILGTVGVASAQGDGHGGPDRQGDFIDTRLTFTFGDDDLFSPDDERLPPSPLPGIGDRSGYELFYDNLDTPFTGRDNVAHLVLHREMPAFADDVTTEAALVLRLDLEETDADGAARIGLSDSGSWVGVRYQPWLAAPQDGVSLSLLPLDSDRIRVGYTYDLTFGGSSSQQSLSGLSPGAELRVQRGLGYYFVAVKTALGTGPDSPLLSDPLLDEEDRIAPGDRLPETQYGLLGGLGWDLFGDTVRAELSGGWFRRGRLRNDAGTTLGQTWTAAGAARLVVHENLNIQPSLDLQLYENDPNQPFRQFIPAEYVPGQLGWLVSAEGIALRSRLGDTDAVAGLTDEDAVAGAVRARVQYDYLRVEVQALYRQAKFVLRHRPGLVPRAFSVPDSATDEPELFASLTVDWHFPTPRLTVGASGGIQLPAALAFGASPPPGLEAQANRSLVVRNARASDTVEERELVVALRVFGRMDLSEMLWSMLWVQYVRDPNSTDLDDGGVLLRQPADRLGAGISLAARF